MIPSHPDFALRRRAALISLLVGVAMLGGKRRQLISRSLADWRREKERLAYFDC